LAFFLPGNHNQGVRTAHCQTTAPSRLPPPRFTGRWDGDDFESDSAPVALANRPPSTGPASRRHGRADALGWGWVGCDVSLNGRGSLQRRSHRGVSAKGQLKAMQSSSSMRKDPRSPHPREANTTRQKPPENAFPQVRRFCLGILVGRVGLEPKLVTRLTCGFTKAPGLYPCFDPVASYLIPLDRGWCSVRCTTLSAPRKGQGSEHSPAPTSPKQQSFGQHGTAGEWAGTTGDFSDHGHTLPRGAVRDAELMSEISGPTGAVAVTHLDDKPVRLRSRAAAHPSVHHAGAGAVGAGRGRRSAYGADGGQRRGLIVCRTAPPVLLRS